jgi:general secretion pathway protein D
VLVIGSDPGRIRSAMEWIARLDRENQEGTNYYVYQVQNGKAPELAKLLSASFGQGGPGPGLGGEVAPDQAVAEVAIRGTLAPQGSGRDASGITTQASDGPAGAIRITASATDNTLIIRAPQREYRKILGVLREVDRAAPQVMINTTLAEVTLNDNLSYGVQAFLKTKDVKLGVFTTGLLLAPKFPGLNFLLGSASDPRLILDALAQVTSVRILSSPSLVVQNNQPAVIKVGDQVPITTQQVVATQTPDAPIVSAIEYRDAGMILRVTPRVSATGLVTMEIDQELSAVTSSDATLTPTISQRSITSTISVYSRQTVVLGGLMSSQESHDHSGVPLVNTIPVLGHLFGTTGKRLQRTELIVFITPQVIRDSIEASEVSEELRSKLHLLAH